MNYIIVIFHPFEIEQEVKVYQHGKCIEQMYPSLENIVKIICGLNKQYCADRIELCGNPSFVSEYIKELKSNFSTLPTIEIIPR